MELNLLENLSPESKVDYMGVIEKVDLIKILRMVRVSKFADEKQEWLEGMGFGLFLGAMLGIALTLLGSALFVRYKRRHRRAQVVQEN